MYFTRGGILFLFAVPIAMLFGAFNPKPSDSIEGMIGGMLYSVFITFVIGAFCYIGVFAFIWKYV